MLSRYSEQFRDSVLSFVFFYKVLLKNGILPRKRRLLIAVAFLIYGLMSITTTACHYRTLTRAHLIYAASIYAESYLKHHHAKNLRQNCAVPMAMIRPIVAFCQIPFNQP